MSIQRMTFAALMTDGTEHAGITPTMADRIEYGTTARKRKWPKTEDDPELYMAFIVWKALRRTGTIGEMSWDDFIATAETIQPEDDEGEDVEPFR